MNIDLEKMSDDELLELFRKIVEQRSARELVAVPKYTFSRGKDLSKAVNEWFGDDLDEEVSGEVMVNFVEPALRKIADYISGNYELKPRKSDPDKNYPVSTNSVKAIYVKKYRRAYNALVDCILELTEKEKSE